MRIKYYVFKIACIASIFLMVETRSFGQCSKKLTEISLYKLSIYKLYYNGLTISDVINTVNQNKKDTIITKLVISNQDTLMQIDSILRTNRCIKNYLCGKIFCKTIESSMDIRHVFVLKFNDSTTIFIGLSSVEKLMMLDEKVYKKERQFIKALYQYF